MRARPLVAVLDHGSGNLHSATRAVAAAGCRVELTADPDVCRDADGLVVPGVGAFAACMAGLDAVGGPALVRERLDAGRPVLGICVGHQVMFAAGVEHGIRAAGIGAKFEAYQLVGREVLVKTTVEPDSNGKPRAKCKFYDPLADDQRDPLAPHGKAPATKSPEDDDIPF